MWHSKHMPLLPSLVLGPRDMMQNKLSQGKPDTSQDQVFQKPHAWRIEHNAHFNTAGG
jgi:hypothetical protein